MPCDPDFDFIIMAMEIRIGAFPKSAKVPLHAPGRDSQLMGCIEMSHAKKGYRMCHIVVINRLAKVRSRIAKNIIVPAGLE